MLLNMGAAAFSSSYCQHPRVRAQIIVNSYKGSIRRRAVKSQTTTMCESTWGSVGQTAASRSLMAPLRTHSDQQSTIANCGPLASLCEWLLRREGSKSHSWGREQEGSEETHHCCLSVVTVKPQLSGERDIESLHSCDTTGGWMFRCVQPPRQVLIPLCETAHSMISSLCPLSHHVGG